MKDEQAEVGSRKKAYPATFSIGQCLLHLFNQIFSFFIKTVKFNFMVRILVMSFVVIWSQLFIIRFRTELYCVNILLDRININIELYTVEVRSFSTRILNQIQKYLNLCVLTSTMIDHENFKQILDDQTEQKK